MQNPLLDESRFEEVACLLCGTRRSEAIFDSATTKTGERIPMRSVLCSCCGLAYASYRPNEEAYEEFYKKFIDFECGVLRNKQLENKSVSLGFENVERAAQFLSPVITKEMHILDLGCSHGKLLFVLKKMFPELGTLGVEIDHDSATYARNIHSLSIQEESLFTYIKIADAGSADVIILRHVLEHILDPIPVLEQLKRLCSAYGHIYFEVPNIQTFTRTAEAFFMPGHVMHFSPETLVLLLLRGGLRMVRLDTSEPGILRVLATPIENPDGFMSFSSFDLRSSYKKTLRHVKFMKRFGSVYSRLYKKYKCISKKLFKTQ